MKRFYVYVILDPRKPGSFQYRDSQIFNYEPFYIGKGKGRRCWDHLGQIKGAKKETTFKANKIRKIFRESGLEPIIIKLEENLFEDAAFELEKLLIKQIGRFDQGRGPLTNLTDGGDGPLASSFSEVTRKKMSRPGEKNPMFGRRRTEEVRKKLRDFNLGKRSSEETKKKMSISQSGENNGMFGKKHLEDSRKKMSEIKIGKNLSEEHKKNISLTSSGENNGMFGRRHSEKSNRRNSEKHLGKKASEETKQKMRDAYQNRKQKQQQQQESQTAS